MSKSDPQTFTQYHMTSQWLCQEYSLHLLASNPVTQGLPKANRVINEKASTWILPKMGSHNMFEMTNANRLLNSPLKTIQLTSTLTNLSWVNKQKRSNAKFLVNLILFSQFCKSQKLFLFIQKNIFKLHEGERGKDQQPLLFLLRSWLIVKKFMTH